MNTAAHGSTQHVAAALLVSFLLGLAAPAIANDWPSWRGRGQTGASEETGLVSNWSPDGENLIWSDTWVGRSTPAVFDGRVCANGRTGSGIDEQEVVACWNAETGQQLWQHNFNVLNTTVPFNRVGWGSVAGDPDTGYLYAMNIDGHLNTFDREGNIVWSWRLAEDLGRASGYGGRTSTPIIDEDQLLLEMSNGISGSGLFEIDVTNFDPTAQYSATKHQIVNMYTSDNGSQDVFDTNEAWWNIRTGTNYGTGLKVLAAASGGDSRDEARLIQNASWNPADIHTFTVEWDSQAIAIYLNGSHLETLPFNGRIQPLQYTFIGRDNVYSGQVGPIYSNLCVTRNP